MDTPKFEAKEIPEGLTPVERLGDLLDRGFDLGTALGLEFEGKVVDDKEK